MWKLPLGMHIHMSVSYVGRRAELIAVRRQPRGAKPLPPMLLMNLRPAQERKARRRVR